jgi:cytochrome P450
VNQAFTPKMVEQLEPRLRQIAGELLDAVVEHGECDLVETLTYPLPVIAIAEILGVEPEKRADFRRWSDEVVATLGGGPTGGGQQLNEATYEEMRVYFGRLCEERRANPRSDLISGLVQAEMDGEKLTSSTTHRH